MNSYRLQDFTGALGEPVSGLVPPGTASPHSRKMPMSMTGTPSPARSPAHSPSSPSGSHRGFSAEAIARSTAMLSTALSLDQKHQLTSWTSEHKVRGSPLACLKRAHH